MSRSLIWLRVLHIVADGMLIWGSFVLAYFIRVGFIFSTDVPFGPYAWVSLFAAAVWSLVLLLTRYYKVPPLGIWKSMIFVFLGAACSTGFLLAAYFFNVGGFFSRLMTLYAIGLAFCALASTNGIFRAYAGHMKKHSKYLHKTLIIGANRIAERLIDRINKDPFAAYEIVGVLDPYGIHKKIEHSTILGKMNAFEYVCEREKVTAVIQCDGFEHTISIISYCDENKIQFQFVPSLRGVFEDNLRMRRIAQTHMISFVQRDFVGSKKTAYWWIDAILWHVFDID
jgi:FlaA1/EpsC-like NDP-sugar epimerase